MSFTRFNYDDARTVKRLQESTDPGRWMLNVPGQGCAPCYFEDPHIRLQKWGANLRGVSSDHPVDIASYLDGRTRRNNQTCSQRQKSIRTTKKSFSTCTSFTDESRVTHPTFLYRGMENTRWEYPLFDPQMNVEKDFQNNLSSRLMERDNFIPRV